MVLLLLCVLFIHSLASAGSSPAPGKCVKISWDKNGTYQPGDRRASGSGGGAAPQSLLILLKSQCMGERKLDFENFFASQQQCCGVSITFLATSIMSSDGYITIW